MEDRPLLCFIGEINLIEVVFVKAGSFSTRWFIILHFEKKKGYFHLLLLYLLFCHVVNSK
jgi:hypothetical protein